MACILLWNSAVRVHDSQAYRKMDVTRERIRRILELREILLSIQTGHTHTHTGKDTHTHKHTHTHTHTGKDTHTHTHTHTHTGKDTHTHRPNLWGPVGIELHSKHHNAQYGSEWKCNGEEEATHIMVQTGLKKNKTYTHYDQYWWVTNYVSLFACHFSCCFFEVSASMLTLVGLLLCVIASMSFAVHFNVLFTLTDFMCMSKNDQSFFQIIMDSICPVPMSIKMCLLTIIKKKKKKETCQLWLSHFQGKMGNKQHAELRPLNGEHWRFAQINFKISGHQRTSLKLGTDTDFLC